MSTLDDFTDAYAELETRVRQAMVEHFDDLCGLCTACCCRTDICEEAAQSAFLARLLARQGLSADAMDDRFGWLGTEGCSLEFGRPPVCYAFFCDELLVRLPDEDTRLVTRVLGKLMDYIGEEAVEGCHLVDIADPGILEKLDLEPLAERLEEAEAAFEVATQFFETGRLGRSDRERLEAIPLGE